MGSFVDMHNFVRQDILKILKTTHQQTENKFSKLFTDLRSEIHTNPEEEFGVSNCPPLDVTNPPTVT